jgi:NAD(P)-dependent dehydrogenase (short-subunit alcohol dehydrogenase family)
MTEEFIALGHVVWGCARSREAIAAMRRRFGGVHAFHTVDVSDEQQVEQWAKQALAAGHVPDLLVNSAAIINQNARLWDVPGDEFSRVIDVNIKGTVNVIRYFVPTMAARSRGVIVNFSSGWGRSTSPEVAPYCATKWAIEGLTRSLAQELPNGMAAVPLNPGIVDTDMLRSCFGTSASCYPDPRRWAKRAVPFLLELGPDDNGKALSVAQSPRR